ncbi:MAG: 50S ribosomal protein L24 [Schlesneria sp.]
MRMRKGDMVVVITGDDAGKTPRKVVRVLDGGERILVEGVNRVYKHVKKGHPSSPQGGRISRELPISSSNAMVYCAHCTKGVRVGTRVSEQSRERYCKVCKGSLGVIGRQKADA